MGTIKSAAKKRKGVCFMQYEKQKYGVAVFLTSMVLLSSNVFADEPGPGQLILKYDRPAGEEHMPNNFRTMQSPFRQLPGCDIQPSREGLNEMQLSGSSYFSENEFREMMKQLPSKRVVVLDLRAESHGYLNEDGVSWYSAYKAANRGLSSIEINQVEKGLLVDDRNKMVSVAALAKDKSVSATTEMEVNSAITEREFVETQQIKYYRLPVVDYDAPSYANVDEFLDFYKNLPTDTWIHAHCEAGEGRTTMFLSMIDMLHNARKLDYDVIMTRQVLLGGQDLRISTSKDPIKQEGYVRRALFTRQFYEYAKSNPKMEKSWSQWAQEQGY